MADVVAIIPARYASTRLPGKPLASIAGKPMIQHVYERTQRAAGVARTLVATDDERVAAAVRAFGGDLVMTGTHATGTDRLAEVVRGLATTEIVVNVQGDLPLLDPTTVAACVAALRARADAAMASLMTPIRDEIEMRNPNVVKVDRRRRWRALFFAQPCAVLARRARPCTLRPPAHRALCLSPRRAVDARGRAARRARMCRRARATTGARAGHAHPDGRS